MKKKIGKSLSFFFIFLIFVVTLHADENLTSKVDDVFGININQLTGALILKAVKEKGAKYKLMSLMPDNRAADTKNPDAVITPCYLGKYLDENEIIKVAYCFPPFGPEGNEMEIEMKGSYKSELLKKLVKIFGISEEQSDSQTGEKYYYWKTKDKKKYNYLEIGLTEESLYDVGPHAKNGDIFYLLLRGQMVRHVGTPY